MPKLNPISVKKLIKILLELGFHEIRIKGSHHFFSHGNGKTTVVPIHGNEDVSVGLLKKILRDMELDVGFFCVGWGISNNHRMVGYISGFILSDEKYFVPTWVAVVLFLMVWFKNQIIVGLGAARR